eukprot:1147015-Pelagomonas_calceolata.AAC.1
MLFTKQRNPQATAEHMCAPFLAGCGLALCIFVMSNIVSTTTSPTLKLKVPDWRTWAYTGDSCQTQNGKQEIGAGVYCPLTDSKSFVEPNGAGITKTI